MVVRGDVVSGLADKLPLPHNALYENRSVMEPNQRVAVHPVLIRGCLIRDRCIRGVVGLAVLQGVLWHGLSICCGGDF